MRKICLIATLLPLMVCSVNPQVQRPAPSRVDYRLPAAGRVGQQNAWRKSTGVRYPEPHEFSAVKGAGYSWAAVEFSADHPELWQPSLDRAAELHLQLIAGLWPLPWVRNADGTWTATEIGVRFLDTLASNSSVILGVYGFNEPYWTDPYTGRNDFRCGNLTADDLRAFRRMIRSYWADARIYHDLGEPGQWAPGGQIARGRSCVGDKYRDQTEIADFVGIWWYPFETDVYNKAESLDLINEQIRFIYDHMSPAEPVAVGQAFASKVNNLRFPTMAEMSDWNCALQRLPVRYLLWYPWRQSIYEDYLFNHPDYWPLTTNDACR